MNTPPTSPGGDTNDPRRLAAASRDDRTLAHGLDDSILGAHIDNTRATAHSLSRNAVADNLPRDAFVGTPSVQLTIPSADSLTQTSGMSSHNDEPHRPRSRSADFGRHRRDEMFQFRDDVTEAHHDRPPRGRPSVEQAPEVDDMEEAMSAVHGAMEADPSTPILATMVSPGPGVVAEAAPDASFHTPETSHATPLQAQPAQPAAWPPPLPGGMGGTNMGTTTPPAASGGMPSTFIPFSFQRPSPIFAPSPTAGGPGNASGAPMHGAASGSSGPMHGAAMAGLLPQALFQAFDNQQAQMQMFQMQMQHAHMENQKEMMRGFATMMENTMDKSRQDSDSTTLKIVERINIAHDPAAKLSKFKDVTASTTVEYVLTQWSLDFQRQEREPSVRRVLTAGIDKGGNLHDWVQPYQIKFQHQIDNADKIDNWSWDRFCSELRASSLNERTQRSHVFDSFEKLECSQSADLSGIKAFVRKFENEVANVHAHDLNAMFPDAHLAMKLFRSLPTEFRAQMNLFPRHPPHPEPDMRFDFKELKGEIAEVLLWDNTLVHYATSKQIRSNNAQVQPTTTRPKQPDSKGGGRLGAETDYIARIRVKRDIDDAGVQRVRDWIIGQRRNNSALEFKYVELRPANGEQSTRKQFMIVHPKQDQLRHVLKQAQTSTIAPVLNMDEISREEPRLNVVGSRPGPRANTAAASEHGGASLEDKNQQFQDKMLQELSKISHVIKSSQPITEPLSCAQSDVGDGDRQPTAASASVRADGPQAAAATTPAPKPYVRPSINWGGGSQLRSNMSYILPVKPSPSPDQPTIVRLDDHATSVCQEILFDICHDVIFNLESFHQEQTQIVDDPYVNTRFISLVGEPVSTTLRTVGALEPALGAKHARQARRVADQARKHRRAQMVARRELGRMRRLQFGNYTSEMVDIIEENGCYVLVHASDGTPLPSTHEPRVKRSLIIPPRTKTISIFAPSVAFVIAHIMMLDRVHLEIYALCLMMYAVLTAGQKCNQVLRYFKQCIIFIITASAPSAYGSGGNVPRVNTTSVCHRRSRSLFPSVSSAVYPSWILMVCVTSLAVILFCLGFGTGLGSRSLAVAPPRTVVCDKSFQHACDAIKHIESCQRDIPRVSRHFLSVFTPAQMYQIRRNVTPPLSFPLQVNFRNPMLHASHTLAEAEEIEAVRACVTINNSVPEGHRLGMVDSGCSDIMLREDDESKRCIANFDTSATAGSSANSDFMTSGRGDISITVDCDLDSRTSIIVKGRYDIVDGDHVVTRNYNDKAYLVWPWNYDLFPTGFWQRHGSDVIFQGRQSHSDPSSGRATIAVYDLMEFTRDLVGTVRLQHWSNLTFFFYRLCTALPSASAGHIGSNRPGRDMLSAKWHTILGHASPRRVRTLMTQCGLDLRGDHLSPCCICSVCKSSSPSRRKYERRNVPADQVRGVAFTPHDPELSKHADQLARSDKAAAEHERTEENSVLGDILEDDESDESNYKQEVERLLQYHDADIIKLDPIDTRYLAAPRRSTAPGQYWHCDTIPLEKCWENARHALVLVDDFSRKVYVYALKNKTGELIVQALHQHFLQCGSSPTGLTFYAHRMTLKSDQGTEFLNAQVHDFCTRIGCIQEYSCPGGGKWQNGTCERRIKDLGTMTRSIMYTSDMPPAASMHALYQAADILNALPTSTNAGGSNSSGLSPDYVYDKSEFVPDNWFAFGSYCTAHLDSDHTDKDKRVTAASCVYLCQAHHCGASGHIIWDYKNNRKLTVPTIATAQWNYFPKRPAGQQHLSNMLTFISPACVTGPETMDQTGTEVGRTKAESPGETASEIRNDSNYMTKYRTMMERHVGDTVRKAFFINGIDGPSDYYEGKVNHITHNNEYHVVYSDGDSESMSHQKFLKFHCSVAEQQSDIRANAATTRHSAPTCNCGDHENCFHPWGGWLPSTSPSSPCGAHSVGSSQEN